jgi:heme-degrading monooxygenase HmoA
MTHMQVEEESWNYLVLWQFDVCEGCEIQFEEAYGANGDWVRLFRTATGFIRTELTRNAQNGRQYVTLDYWVSEQTYDEFRKQHEAEYAVIDARCEGLTQREVELGRFDKVGE